MDDKKEDDMLQKRKKSGGKSLLQVGKSTQFLNQSTSRLRVRHGSYGFSSVPGIGRVRSSQVALEFRRPMLLYLPSYQLDPRSPFHVPSVLKAVNEELDEHFTGHKYNVQQSPALALQLASSLVKRLRDKYDRYRILSVVSVAQRRSQSYTNALTFLWDHERDNYVDVERVATSCFVQVTVFGIYFD